MSDNKKPYLSSALWPGIVLGLLSVIPYINLVNLFCCLWVVGGGFLASLVFKQENGSVSTGQGAIVGLFAGLIGSVVQAIGIGTLWYFFHESYLANLYELFGSAEFDAATQDMMASLITNPWFMMFGSLLLGIFVYTIFAVFGGIIGAAVFNRKAPSDKGTDEGEIEG